VKDTPVLVKLARKKALYKGNWMRSSRLYDNIFVAGQMVKMLTLSNNIKPSQSVNQVGMDQAKSGIRYLETDYV
jgi:hypothetical protein